MIEEYSKLGTFLFAIAILHTFSVKRFQHFSRKFKEGSFQASLFHLLGEVEIVFGFWAAILILILFFLNPSFKVNFFLESLSFTEPLFVFAIMVMASTKPILEVSTTLIKKIASKLPLNKALAFYVATLVIGPLLGGFITEPAAMTVTALILKKYFYDEKLSERFKYITIAVLFVNVSIGGVLTHFAAPPVLMVASLWNWDTPYMFDHFGWKAILAILFNTSLATYLLKNEIKDILQKEDVKTPIPVWVTILHLIFIAFVVFNSHRLVVFMALYFFFLGLTTVTKRYQNDLKMRESLLVGFFLSGLVVFGAFQTWWLKPFLTTLTTLPLFIGTTILTGFVDNAAITFLGAQVQGLSEEMKYALVAGACAGGGLTVIANAPNPAGFSILSSSFGKEGISPLKLFTFAVIPTIIAMSAFWFL